MNVVSIRPSAKVVSFQLLGKAGRLGNSLFQLAATIGLAADRGFEPRFNADWLYRPYFSVPDEFFTPISNEDDVIEAVDLVPWIDSRARVYLQDFNVFSDYMPTIRRYLSLSDEAQEILEGHAEGFKRLASPVLSVHVRRGDNVPGQDRGVPDKWNFFPLPPASYYLEAIELMRSSHDRKLAVAVFSDEILWCQDHIPADYYHDGVTRPKEHEPDYLTAPVLDWIDVVLMGLCQAHVVANSSFGVWGALLAGDLDAIVCDPFYGPRLDYIDASLQYPSSWRRLPFKPTLPQRS